MRLCAQVLRLVLVNIILVVCGTFMLFDFRMPASVRIVLSYAQCEERVKTSTLGM